MLCRVHFLGIENKAIDRTLKDFDKRLLYSMEIAIISRAQSEGLFFNMMEGESLKTKIRENYYKETGERL